MAFVMSSSPMEKPNRLVVGLSAAAFVWCFIAAVWMTTIPMMSGGRRPTVGEAVAMGSIPAGVALVASWAAWRRRRGLLAAMVVVSGLFALVTGFSIGAGFVPTFVLLVWAGIATIDDETGPSSEDPV